MIFISVTFLLNSGQFSHLIFLMKSIIRKYWQNNTFSAIMIIAIILRLLAAIFSKGYAMSDDHFVVIHVAQRWVDGFNDWFNRDHLSGFSLVYTGFHYLLFYCLKLIDITDPTIKMYIVRLIHAAYSLLTVYFGYKIALKISNLSDSGRYRTGTINSERVETFNLFYDGDSHRTFYFAGFDRLDILGISICCIYSIFIL